VGSNKKEYLTRGEMRTVPKAAKGRDMKGEGAYLHKKGEDDEHTFC